MTPFHHITIYGFGKVGRTLSYLLLNSTIAPLSINIIDPSPEVSGSILDIFPVLHFYGHKVHFNQQELISESDFVFYTAGLKNKHGESRLTVARENAELTREIFSKQKFDNTPYIIVITNPVDAICCHIWQSTGLPPDRIIGTGTYLDSVRLSYHIAQALDITIHDVDAWVLGEHGESMVPVYSQSTVRGELITGLPWWNEAIREQFTLATRGTATKIRQTQGASYYSVARCATAIMEALLNDKQKVLPAGVMINDYYKTVLGCDTDLYLSLPVAISKEGIKVVNDFVLSTSEHQELQHSAQVIEEHLLH